MFVNRLPTCDSSALNAPTGSCCQKQGQEFFFLRKTRQAIATKPIPMRLKLPGSGTSTALMAPLDPALLTGNLNVGP